MRIEGGEGSVNERKGRAREEERSKLTSSALET